MKKYILILAVIIFFFASCQKRQCQERQQKDLASLLLADVKTPINGIQTRKSYAGTLEINDIIFPDITILEMDESADYDFIIGVQFLIGFIFDYEGQRSKWSITC